MADLDYTLIFNFNFNSSGGKSLGQTLNTTREARDSFNVLNYVIDDIAFYAAKRQQTEVRQNLEEKFTNIVRVELGKMGRKIASMAIGVGSRLQGPSGRLELEGTRSNALAALGQSTFLNPARYSGPWAARNKKYLAWKRKKYGHTKWFLNTKNLRQQLRDASLYTSSFGGVRVKFDAEQIAPGNTAVRRVSQFTRTRGRPSGRISVGQIQLSVLGRITQDMLADPDQRTYDSRFNGLFEMLPDDIALKLGGRESTPFRSVIEPFLSFYLTRQIPNRIFAELEKSTRDRATGQSGARPFT